MTDVSLVRESPGEWKLTGRRRRLSNEQILSAAFEILRDELKRGSVMDSPDTSRRFLYTHFHGLEHEAFGVLFLDTKHRLIEFEEMFRGTIDSASVYPREIVKTALKHNAAAVIFAHNHPSGDATPSAADQALTRRLKEALDLVDVRVLDHLVVGHSIIVSFAERGLI